MYRIIGIIALVGTLAGCNNPTDSQSRSTGFRLPTKSFDAEYKITLQSGPFREKLTALYGPNIGLADPVIVTSLPWSVKKRETNSVYHEGASVSTGLIVKYDPATRFAPPTTSRPETIYHVEIWINGEIKERQVLKINDERFSYSVNLKAFHNCQCQYTP